MSATASRSGTAFSHSRSRAAAGCIPKPRQSLSACTGKGRRSRQQPFDVYASATGAFRRFAGAGQKGLAHLTAIQTKKVIQRHFSFSFQVNHNGCLSLIFLNSFFKGLYHQPDAMLFLVGYFNQGFEHVAVFDL